MFLLSGETMLWWSRLVLFSPMIAPPIFFLAQTDPEIHRLVNEEASRQARELELIASENYTSQAVMEAVGSCLTNKYSEGYPGKRYYGGNDVIDKVEQTAINRAKQLFGAEHANVQPHSGATANAAAYFATCKPGDTVLAMNLAHGGHLTHGSRVNFSGAWFTIIPYGVHEDTHLIDMDEVRRLAHEHKPRLIIAGGSAYPRQIDFKTFGDIAQEVGAYLLVDMAHIAGLVATGLHPSPFPYADIVTTTTHKTLRGPRGGCIFSKTLDRLDVEGKKTLAQKIDSAVFPGIQGGPLEHVIAGKAVAFHEAAQPWFTTYQQQVLKNAQVMAQTLLGAGGRLISHGTDNHLLLVDVTPWGITGKEAEARLASIGICVNKNMIPFDPRSPMDPSGIRLGTPALTTRGCKEDDTIRITDILIECLKKTTDLDTLRKRVADITHQHPPYTYGA